MDGFGFCSRYAEGAAHYRALELVLARKVGLIPGLVYTHLHVFVIKYFNLLDLLAS
jgi:hypothetical protein